jgi:hypothetical protein
MRALLRIAAVTTATGLLLAPVAGAASASASHPAVTHAATVHVRGGTTSLTTVPGLGGALIAASIVPFATAPGTESLVGSTSNPQFKFSFPVTGGQVNPSRLHGSIKHRGGILFVNTSNGDAVKVSRLTINLTHRRLSGVVSTLGVRVVLAKLSFAHAKVRVRSHSVKVRRIGARLTTAAATALNTALGTTLFTPGMKIATVATLVRF